MGQPDSNENRGKVDVMYNNLIEIIISKKEEEKRGIYFIRNEKQEEFLSYGKLFRLAWQQKEKMKQAGLEKGTEVILQYEDNRSFVIAFWACILGKMVPVPQAVHREKESMEHILKIYQKLNNPIISTIAARRKEITQYAKEQNIEEIDFFELVESKDDNKFSKRIDDVDMTVKEEETAFIQFSSGSTGKPKGVVVSHKNLMENFIGMIADSQIKEDDSMLSWMPICHNLGLIVSHLLGLVCNLDNYLMSTDLFIYQPYLWMEKISEHKVTLTCSPNFGYRYYLRGIMNRDCSGLDLSHLRIILNGAEPISLKACNTFLEMMKPYGLKENVFQTGYGLAEATVSVTSTAVGKPLESVRISGEDQGIGKPVCFVEEENGFVVELVKVGYPHYNVNVQIADENGNPLEEDYFGEIQINGSIVTSGYYDGMQQGDQITVKDGWLSTGDIGFLHKGQLVISGRKKDIIFVNGKNYYCQDLEGIIREEYPNCECAICGIYKEEAERDLLVLFLVKGEQTFIELRKFGDVVRKRITRRTGLVIDKVVLVNEIPKTSSGKIQRFQLKEYFRKGQYYDLYHQYTRAQVVDMIQEQVKRILGFTMDDLDESLVEAGMNSMKAASFHKLMSQVFEVDLPVSVVYDYPSVHKIADFILGEHDEEAEVKQERKADCKTEDIAVIGMACEFPNGADSLEHYWEKLLQEYDGITDVPDDRTELKEYCQREQITLKGGFLSGIDQFDAIWFGITPKEAKYIDPQQRLLLKNTYRALEDACLDVKKLRGSQTGVYVGISNSDYKDNMPKEENDSHMLSGTMNNMAAGRISYTFDFQGPSLVVDTACSSSLVAVHQAVLSLRAGECDLALAGGVNCILSKYGYLGLSHMNALSPTWHCHTFDERADGYVRSEGCGMVVLKRYHDAVANGDRIYAVIKGSAVNSDGWSSGLTAPNGTAQVRVMRQALMNAKVRPTEVSFVETHGTGTRLGDPQEINALNLVYGVRGEPMFLGAGKTNIGHTESAAGIAAFIKTALSIYHGVIPGNRDVRKLNPLIPWKNMMFHIPVESTPWVKEERIAGVSAFGLSGTNVHVILAQGNVPESNSYPNKEPQILMLSAKKKDQLVKEAATIARYLEESLDPLASVLYTVGRCLASEKYKLGIAAKTRSDYIDRLKKWIEKKGNTVLEKADEKQKVAMLFGGIHNVSADTFRNLYENNTVFCKTADECSRIVKKITGMDLQPYFEKKDTDNEQILFYKDMITEYGIYKVLRYFGVKPDLIVGHGKGEWIGAACAGILTVRQAFYFAYCMEQVKKKYGEVRKTALLFASEEEIAMEPALSIEAVNAKNNIMVSYQEENDFVSFVAKNKISYLKLPDYKTVWIQDKDAAAKEFWNLTEQEKIALCKIPYLSTTGQWSKSDEEGKAMDFTRLITKKAQIFRTMKEMETRKCSVYLECNIKPYLSALAEQNLAEPKQILPVIRHTADEELQLRSSVAKLYELGIEIEACVQNVHGDWLVQLPGCEWKQSRYWF